VIRVGTGGVYNVVLMSTLRGTLLRPAGAINAMADQVWSHLTRTARLGRIMGPAFGVPPEEAVTLALLHDVGKLVIFDRLADLRKRLRRDPRLPQTLVLSALKQLHESIGAAAILHWKLGESAAHSVSVHHREPVPEVHDPGSELIYVTERTDLAQIRGQEIDWELMWAEGQLSAAREDAESAFSVAQRLLGSDPGQAAA
jgi:HD-like signal output (HDOD) protein